LLANTTSIFAYLQKMNGLYAIPIFAVVIVGMLARRVPAVAAKVALVVGFTVMALGYFVPPLAVYVERIHAFHFQGAVFVLLVVVMLAIGVARPLPEAWQQRYSGDVEMTPWKYAKPMGIVLIIIVFMIYAVFADFSVLTR
jgi:SSS family solute:Na+ symporter